MRKPLNWDSFFIKWGCYSRQCDTHENQDTWLACHYITNTKSSHELNTNATVCCGGVRLDNVCSFPLLAPETGSLSNLNVIELSCEDNTSIRRKTKTYLHKDGNSTGCGTSLCSIHFTNNASLQCPWILAVFDGHGRGGYVAAKIASQSLKRTLGQLIFSNVQPMFWHETFPNAFIVLQHIQSILSKSIYQAHLNILESHQPNGFDFGTTAALTVLLGRYLLTATCGDSSSLFIVNSTSKLLKKSILINIRLTVDHSCRNPNEQKRIKSLKKGMIVKESQGGLRLIPSTLTLDQAKKQGLAINMTRALGHSILSSSGLSCEPCFTLFDIVDIYNFLKTRASYNYYLFQAQDFDVTCDMKFQQKTHTDSFHDSSLHKSPNEDYEVVVMIENNDRVNRIPTHKTTERSCPFHYQLLVETTYQNSHNPANTSIPWCSLSEFMENSVFYNVVMSDGISDVMSARRISHSILQKHSMKWGPQKIAKTLSAEALHIRKKHRMRHDNCTAIVANLCPHFSQISISPHDNELSVSNHEENHKTDRTLN
ncbi:uncharacterized protein LOC128883666 [Hylaeus volcanicus]|uniref:uncharacterized protein LOC128883666 n=1 Tax=Hylaeus volcanicus TaxID=313075 RepID=UPI0023B7CEC1|nr:uncharacterized protein LOC128883666 [Hylaeus volcanicus]